MSIMETSANKKWEVTEKEKFNTDKAEGGFTRLKPMPLILPNMSEEKFTGIDNVLCVDSQNTHIPEADDYIATNPVDLFRYDEFPTDLRNGRESAGSDGMQNFTYSSGPSTWSSNLRNSGSSESPINGLLEETSSQDSSCAGSTRGSASFSALRNAEIASALNPGYFGGRALLMTPPCDASPSLAATSMLAQTREEKLLELTNKTGYNIVQRNGQMIYGGPPPNWYGPAPCKGSEVFVGKVPRDIFEDELVPIFERVGKIYELRLMMDFSGSNRGYFFVRYTCKEDAKRAVRELNNYEIRPNKQLGVIHSVDNRKLWISGIPQNRTPSEIQADMERLTDGVRGVILYSSQQDKSKSRGYAFVEYESHRAAALARRKLVPGRIFLCGQEIEKVDWAEPENEVDEETMAKVRVLFLRNLMTATTELRIRQIFNYLSGGQVERVKKNKDFAFVHFTTRQAAELAKYQADNVNLSIDGTRVEVTWSKPVNKALTNQKKQPILHGYQSSMNQSYQEKSVIRPNSMPALDFHPHPNFQEPPPNFINYRGHNLFGQNTNMFPPGSVRKITGNSMQGIQPMQPSYMPHHSLLTEQFLQTLQELKIHGNMNAPFLPTNGPTMYQAPNQMIYGQNYRGQICTGNLDQMAADQLYENPYSVPPPNNFMVASHPSTLESNNEKIMTTPQSNISSLSNSIGLPTVLPNQCGQAYAAQNLTSSATVAPNIE